MIDSSHILELRNKFYYISNSFGGPEALIDTINNDSNDQEELELKIHQILSHPDDIKVISPWDIRFSLIDENVFNNTSINKSIVMEMSYKIFDFNRCLLYTVKKHNGVWGNSPLDKLLVLQSPSGRLFYLQHPTYDGLNRTILLIVNNLSLSSSNALSDYDLLKSPPFIDESSGSNFNRPSIEPQDNIIIFYLFKPIDKVKIYHLKSGPTIIPTKDEIINNRESKIYEYLSTSAIAYYPSSSGWFVMVDKNNNPLIIGDIKGNGVDRFVGVDGMVYYIAVGDEMDTVLLRQKLGLVNRRPPDFSRRDIIQLQVNVIN